MGYSGREKFHLGPHKYRGWVEVSAYLRLFYVLEISLSMHDRVWERTQRIGAIVKFTADSLDLKDIDRGLFERTAARVDMSAGYA